MNRSTLKYNENWFAVYTQSRAEKKVFERLEKAGVETFLPLVAILKQWSDRKKKVEQPLIKSYVFVKANILNLNSVLYIPGVLNILKYLGKPAIVKDSEIENLKILVNNNEHVQEIDSIDLSKGEIIEVVKGPFTGLIAKYIHNSGKHRVIVEVEALKICMEVLMPINNIKKVTS